MDGVVVIHWQSRLLFERVKEAHAYVDWKQKLLKRPHHFRYWARLNPC